MAQRHKRKIRQSEIPSTPHAPAANAQEEVEVLEEVQYVIEEEYEQLKRKGGRRIVAAGALALVAGGLFAAATTSKTQPTLVVSKPENQKMVTEILRPTNAASGVNFPALPADDASETQNIAMVRANKNGETVMLSDAERKAELARLQREKAQRMAQLRKQEAERAERERLRQANAAATASGSLNQSGNTATAKVAPTKPVKTQAELAEERRLAAEARQKAREEEARRRKAQQQAQQQANAAEKERARQEIERAEKVRQAQIAADKARAEARAKLAEKNAAAVNNNNNTNTATAKPQTQTTTPQKTQPTTNPEPKNNQAATPNVDKVQQEKQRAQRIAAERERKQQIVIQAGSFADKTQAQKVQQQLKSMNYQSNIEEVKTEKGTVYRVRTGKFNNREEADNSLKNMKEKGVKGIILGQ